MKGVTGRHCLPVFLALMIALPGFAQAQVVINEIMYNPQGSDTGREWVELYNEGGSDVTMVGGTVKGSWRVNDGSNHTLTDPAGGTGRGSLTIPAGGYLLIASDPSDFISGEYAGGAYSVVKSSISLNNAGATISLVDGTGATLDSVSYTPAQGASDDGTSLQRQADGSWIAALPTPGAANATTPYVAPSGDDSSSQSNQSPAATSSDQTASTTSTTTTTPTVVESSYVPPPSPSVYADAGGDKTVIVGADVEFDAEAYDKNQNVLDDSAVRFMWNFGDGATAEGEAVEHHFSYPGRYAVVLDIADQKFAASDEVAVTALPAQLSFSILDDGGVAIQNLAGRDLDLSGWIVQQSESGFSAQFMLPPHSVILSGSSMQIARATLGFAAASSTMLEYPNGSLALAMGESSVAASSATLTPAQTSNVQNAQSAPPAAVAAGGTASPTPARVEETPIKAIPPDDPTETDSSDASSPEAPPLATSARTHLATSSQTAGAALTRAEGSYAWWIAAFALALLGGAALFAAKHFGKREWDITEEQ